MDNAQLINQTSHKVDYGTPPAIIERARRVMGSIDLDPASSYSFNRIVAAQHIYTAADDGLSRPWYGNVWLNHPFRKGERACKPNCKKKRCYERGYCIDQDVPGNEDWINKFIHEYVYRRMKQGMCITFASTSEGWFFPLLQYPQCFIGPGRVNYILPDGTETSGSTKGSVVTYQGPNLAGFKREFEGIGAIKIEA